MFTKSHNYLKSILVFLISTGIFFTSCQNFINGSNLREAIQKEIEYINAEEVGVLISPKVSTYGTTFPSGNKVYKISDIETVNFKPNDGFQFEKWVVIDYTTEEEISSAIKIYTPNSTETKIEIIGTSDHIQLCPVVYEIPKVVDAIPHLAATGVSCDTAIVLTFNTPMKKEDLECFDNISLRNSKASNSDSFVNYYENPVLSEDGKILTIQPKSDSITALFGSQVNKDLYIYLANCIETSDGKKWSDYYDDEIEVLKTKINSTRETDIPYFNAIFLTNLNNNLSVRDSNFSSWTNGAAEYTSNHMKSVNIACSGYDSGSGVKSVRVVETLVYTVDGTPVENDPGIQSVNPGEITVDRDYLYSTSFDYQLQSSSDGVVKLDVYLVDFAGHDSIPKTFYLIKDTTPPDVSDMYISTDKNCVVDDTYTFYIHNVFDNYANFGKTDLTGLTICLTDGNNQPYDIDSEFVKDHQFIGYSYNYGFTSETSLTMNAMKVVVHGFNPYLRNVFKLSFTDLMGCSVTKQYSIPGMMILDSFQPYSWWDEYYTDDISGYMELIKDDDLMTGKNVYIYMRTWTNTPSLEQKDTIFEILKNTDGYTEIVVDSTNGYAYNYLVDFYNKDGFSRIHTGLQEIVYYNDAKVYFTGKLYDKYASDAANLSYPEEGIRSVELRSAGKNTGCLEAIIDYDIENYPYCLIEAVLYKGEEVDPYVISSRTGIISGMPFPEEGQYYTFRMKTNDGYVYYNDGEHFYLSLDNKSPDITEYNANQKLIDSQFKWLQQNNEENVNYYYWVFNEDEYYQYMWATDEELFALQYPNQLSKTDDGSVYLSFKDQPDGKVFTHCVIARDESGNYEKRDLSAGFTALDKLAVRSNTEGETRKVIVPSIDPDYTDEKKVRIEAVSMSANKQLQITDIGYKLNSDDWGNTLEFERKGERGEYERWYTLPEDYSKDNQLLRIYTVSKLSDIYTYNYTYYFYGSDKSESIDSPVLSETSTGYKYVVPAETAVFIHFMYSDTDWGDSVSQWEFHGYEGEVQLKEAQETAYRINLVNNPDIKNNQDLTRRYYKIICYSSDGSVLFSKTGKN